MSNLDVISEVTATLKKVLEKVIINNYKSNSADNSANNPMDSAKDIFKNITISISPPDYDPDSSASIRRINLFLYKVTENPYLKNQEIPGTGNPGNYGCPPLSLDLHYLLTAFGDSEFDVIVAHRLLGWAMKAFHDYPIITKELYKNVTADEETSLSLWNQFEKLKIVLDPLSLEDLMKIWTALAKPYRLSVAYTVSVVQIESDRKRTLPRPPVQGPQVEAKVYAVPSRIPRIKEIHAYRGSNHHNKKESNAPYASIGDTLIILGKNFIGDFRVMLDDLDVTDQITFIKDDSRIELTVPDRIELQPGPQAVAIAFKMKMGKLHEEQEHIISNSNQGIFILTPRVDKFILDPNGVQPIYRISGSRLCNQTMECMMWIGDELIPSAKYIPVADPDNPGEKILPTDSITIPKDAVAASLSVDKIYPVRVRVNGAENAEIGKTLDQ